MLALEPRRAVIRIPMTPLIDVVFILLLFFMLSSSFQRLQQLTLQSAGNGDVSEKRDESSYLLVRKNDELAVDGRFMALQSYELQQTIERWRQENTPVYISAAADTEVQQLVSVLDRLRSAGLTRLNLSPTVVP